MNPQQQRAFFEERGYLIVPDLLDNDEIAASRAEIKRLHQLATDLHTREDPLRGLWPFSARTFRPQPQSRRFAHLEKN